MIYQRALCLTCPAGMNAERSLALHLRRHPDHTVLTSGLRLLPLERQATLGSETQAELQSRVREEETA